mgnify:CR=1 FL=1
MLVFWPIYIIGFYYGVANKIPPIAAIQSFTFYAFSIGYGLRAEVDISGRRPKKALDYANREGLEQVLILGENELAWGKIRLKFMQDGREEDVALEQLIEKHPIWFL